MCALFDPSSSSSLHPTAATPAARAPEAAAATGLTASSAATDQAVWLGQRGQAASCHKVPAGDPARGGAADETAEGAAAVSHLCCPAEPHPKQSCTHLPFFLE